MSDNYYNDRVEELAQQYLSLSFDKVHGHWAHHLSATLKKPNASILDIGAGVGRDVSHIATLAGKNATEDNKENNSLSIYAIEPAIEMFRVGQVTTQNQNVHWLQDSLLALDKTTRLEISFDLILLSAVWMHVPKSQRARSLRKLANLLKPGGKVIISLKFGMSEEDQKQRDMHDISAEEIERLGQDLGLVSKLETQNGDDKLNRNGIVNLHLKLNHDLHLKLIHPSSLV
jgi:2-polyprenyl-3-methyl-5-hydroxy-6-metoxy-1,4-benzoquinol methylase